MQAIKIWKFALLFPTSGAILRFQDCFRRKPSFLSRKILKLSINYLLYFYLLNYIKSYYIILYYIILNYIILYYIILYYIILYYIILYYIISYYIILYYIILYYIILYYIILYYIILYYIMLYYIILYYIMLYYTPIGSSMLDITCFMMAHDNSNNNLLNNTISINNNTNSSLAHNLTKANSTIRRVPPYATAEPVEICFLIFLMVVILFGNSMVCCAFSTVERKLRTVTNYFVINLAVSDILVGTFSMVLWLCLRTGLFLS